MHLPLGRVQEGVVGGAHALQEQVVAGQELRVALQQEHRDGQHAAQDVREAVPQLRTPEPCLAVHCMQCRRLRMRTAGCARPQLPSWCIINMFFRDMLTDVHIPACLCLSRSADGQALESLTNA